MYTQSRTAAHVRALREPWLNGGSGEEEGKEGLERLCQREGASEPPLRVAADRSGMRPAMLLSRCAFRIT